MSNSSVPDMLAAMVLARYEVRLTYNPDAIDMPYTCHTAHGNRLTAAVEKSFYAIRGEDA